MQTTRVTNKASTIQAASVPEVFYLKGSRQLDMDGPEEGTTHYTFIKVPTSLRENY